MANFPFQRLTAELSSLISRVPAGQQLPSEPELAKQLGVSRATLREARPTPLVARVVLGVFRRQALLSLALVGARVLRATQLPRRVEVDGLVGQVVEAQTQAQEQLRDGEGGPSGSGSPRCAGPAL